MTEAASSRITSHNSDSSVENIVILFKQSKRSINWHMIILGIVGLVVQGLSFGYV